MTINYEDFITAKIWALLHDPPNKGLILKEHEELSEQAAAAFLGQAVPKYLKELVRKADIFASTIERAVSIYIKDFEGLCSNYINILNIFDTRYKAYNEYHIREAIENHREWINNFIKDLKKLHDECTTVPINIKYLILFTTLEAIWAKSNACWVSPGDTRFPTHTVFDHVYTVATMVNWFLEGDEPSGYLVFFDIPGIQSFITASRRSLDYWASSMIISYLVIKTFEELIEKIGPDIFVTPSMRHNPLLKVLLFFHILPSNVNDNKILNSIRSRIGGLWNFLFNISLVLQPVMPGTALCVLPKFDKIKNLNISANLNNTEAIRDYIINRFYTSWNDLVENVLGSEKIDGILDKNILKDFEKIIDIARSTPFATPRVIVMNIDEIYSEYRQKYYNTVRKVLESFKDSIEKFEKACNEFLKKMFYHVLFSFIIRERILRSNLREERIATFGKYINYIDELYHQNLSSRINVNLRYCSICRRFFSIPFIQHDNVKTTYEIIREDYRGYVKSNELLCHICLIRRFFSRAYVRSRYNIGIRAIPSTDLIANTFVFDILREISCKVRDYGYEKGEDVVSKICDIFCNPDSHKSCILFLRGLLRKDELDGRGFKFEECSEDLYRSYEEFRYLFEYYHYGDSLSESRRTLSNIISNTVNIFEKLVRSPDEIRIIIRDKIRRFFCIGSYIWEDSLCDSLFNRVVKRAKVYYAIIKGDGDSIGNIIFGKILSRRSNKNDLLTFEEYFKNIADNVCSEINGDNRDRCREGFRKLVCILRELKNSIEECSETELDGIILSPTYHSVLSASLMITSIKDIETCEECHCYVVYAGGDDIAALCPVETSLKMIYETRRNYQALYERIPYFHRIGNGASVLPTLTRFGRSYGVRIAHILDPMQLEIEKCTHVLEKFAKKSTWINIDNGTERSKDTLAFSYGRSGRVSEENVCKIPLIPEWNITEIVTQIFACIAARLLSRNLCYDVEKYLSALNNINSSEYNKDTIDSLISIAKYIIERNVLTRDKVKDIHIIELLENTKRLRKLCSIVEKIDDNKVRPLLMHVMRLVAMLITS
ncbi:MAG: type III-B CRISPR-associated protein Cas10/Cmr2, partial [Crenarchaeota archaeon]|nr:type III-B CRISPR-associated protein Cas10/Cmr2 [Thermoproteota archaeon]